MAITRDDFRTINFQAVDFISNEVENINRQLIKNVRNSFSNYFSMKFTQSILSLRCDLDELIDNSLGNQLSGLVRHEMNDLSEEYNNLLGVLYSRELSEGSINYYVEECEKSGIKNLPLRVEEIKNDFIRELERNVVGMSQEIYNNIKKYVDSITEKYVEEYNNVISRSFRGRRDLANELISELAKSNQAGLSSTTNIESTERMQNQLLDMIFGDNDLSAKDIADAMHNNSVESNKEENIIPEVNSEKVENTIPEVNSEVNQISDEPNIDNIHFENMSTEKIEGLMEYLNGILANRRAQEEVMQNTQELEEETQLLPGGVLL